MLRSRLLAEELPPPNAKDGGVSPWRNVARTTAIFTLIGSAIIHFGQVRVHLAEWRPAGVTFLVLAGVELVLAVALAVRASRLAYFSGIAASAATIVLWLVSRTVGIPFGPDAFEPEPVARPDVTATALEVLTVVALLTLYRSPPKWNGSARASRQAYASMALIAVLVASSTWFALLPSGRCNGHDASLTGPLIPIDGHSILGRNTPVSETTAKRDVGLVVGHLKNCGASPLIVRTARLISVTDFEDAARSLSFWVVPPALAHPGAVLPHDVLKEHGVPLPGEAEVPASEESDRTSAMVLLVHTIREGDFAVNAVRIAYTVGERTYTSPYATVARLRVSGPGSED